MGAQRKRYTPAYRREAAHLVIDTGRTIAQVAQEIGVGAQVLGRWVAVERARMDDPPEALDADERAELDRLRRENAELRMDREFLKKGSGLLRGRELEPVEAFEVIAAEKATIEMPVRRMVELLGVSRSGYDAWAVRRDAGPGPRQGWRADLAVKIRLAHDASDGVSGAPRITAALREAGEVVSVKTVATIMREQHIRGISLRPWQPVTTGAFSPPVPKPLPRSAPGSSRSTTDAAPQRTRPDQLDSIRATAGHHASRLTGIHQTGSTP